MFDAALDKLKFSAVGGGDHNMFSLNDLAKPPSPLPPHPPQKATRWRAPARRGFPW
jgi:hypothetical protein